ncbi:MAG: VOC family protein [Armatimonadetes bacterium]|nr:VOC family protein [Armatimonadota bacterium]
MNAIIPNAGIHHVALHTRDYDATVSFYTEVLGMAVAKAWTAGDGRRLALLDIGDGACLEVIGFAPDTPTPAAGQHSWMHVALRTSDPDGVWQRAIGAGRPSIMEPKDVSLGEHPARIAFFEGPSGEIVELFADRG